VNKWKKKRGRGRPGTRNASEARKVTGEKSPPQNSGGKKEKLKKFLKRPRGNGKEENFIHRGLVRKKTGQRISQ